VNAQPAPMTMAWRLVEVCTRKLELSLERRAAAGRTMVEIGFPKTVLTTEVMDTLLDASMDEHPSSHNSRPLAGSHLLVVCARRELRVEIREALQSMGLMVDFVGTVEEAREFCASGLPHAVIFEASQGGMPMQRLMVELRQDAPGIVFIEVAESGKPFQVNNIGGHEVSCVARSALREALPTALTFELSRGA
jgi:CheY-like chemotaxis protein